MVGGQEGVFEGFRCSNCLAQGFHQEWKLYSVDDIVYDEEEECWLCQWSRGTSAASVSIHSEPFNLVLLLGKVLHPILPMLHYH